MKPSDQVPEHIKDDSVLAPLQQQFSIEPPADLDQHVKQMFRDTLAQQHAKFDDLAEKTVSERQWHHQLLDYWQLFRNAPAIAGILLSISLLAGVVSGLLLPSPWRNQEQVIQPADASMVLRNGSLSTQSQVEVTAKNANLPAEQWLEIIAELLIQQRVEEAHDQLQAFRKKHPHSR